MSLNVIILAAGQGKRMNSKLPKVLQPIAGMPMLGHVVEAGRALSAERMVVVYGHGGEQVKAAFARQPDIRWAHQAEQLGTGHAVAQALPDCSEGVALILYGDCPLITASTLQTLLAAAGDNKLAVLTAVMDNPTGYGRMVRDSAGQIVRIVEQKDASDAEKAIREINTGFIAAPLTYLREWLPRLKNANAQGEYYLTDVIAMAVENGVAVTGVIAADVWEPAGVNDKRQLAELERVYQRRQADKLLAGGVTLLDPSRFDLRGTVEHGQDVEIDVNVILEGKIKFGNGVKIGPNVYLKNATLGDGVVVKANTVIEDSIVGAGSDLGPFARIRPDSVLGEKVHIGNFVEIKKATLGNGTKAGHLSYLGDAVIGERVNISAGVITCNYDGANKFVTTIGDDAFIGTDSQLVAPVTIADRAYIGAGSTITKDAPADALTVCRAREQKSLLGWKKPQKITKA
ncbi:bifunctional UDP-N-acetylglucosamine diphosphorylase/glucosamine-1-phosphate N-acetyltransferase GlmU [Chitinimonas sp. BJB300]|uniref:bifunctional UDP-N-acetylglucosamine diphosphorylase/glucosamine-1-phosphate N-acetyltransferase GlmU n=1 Tax=Chitinimonas sp. BJB300 TaxID=1559339 RepID=UPI000C120713|nr:bifunctional UDP-N-acetylglucosamine diphosphorylase/glucosamine-1-phosphate N-acetyltransferase GlmU [Chitinimonas sp. BJB300]PHV12672.1 UDP-N-acetylglucosamine diphosphorylase/glucosamine-1-phosphate N-acetyltransferase [Chitinimonas sp. BJB300]TSJ91284.1 UDP-N-acetylglucosamine diphosphorylase/glucosamine-1-phosphate N-acetyltransferase [Chitinimonas sp. BJB300]